MTLRTFLRGRETFPDRYRRQEARRGGRRSSS